MSGSPLPPCAGARRAPRRPGAALTAAVATAVLVAALTGAGVLGPRPGTAAGAGAAGGPVVAVGAENEYANVLAQIGGRYVRVSAVLSNPNTDPHTFEASPAVAQEVASAQLVVQNGAGYDDFMTTIEAAAPSASRKVIDVQELRHLPSTTKNPHLWYDPATMPAVASAIARDLGSLEPSHRAYFARRLGTFDRSLAAWRRALATLRARFARAPVATTEPVADDMLRAAGLVNRTPWAFQADVMNGVDPSPQDVAFEQALLRDRRVKVLVYNRQVTDSLTQSLVALARGAHVPVVGVDETMPTPGYDYQSWMVATVRALSAALARATSGHRP